MTTGPLQECRHLCIAICCRTYQQENEEIEIGCQYRTDFNRLIQDNISVILVGSKLLRIVT